MNLSLPAVSPRPRAGFPALGCRDYQPCPAGGRTRRRSRIVGQGRRAQHPKSPLLPPKSSPTRRFSLPATVELTVPHCSLASRTASASNARCVSSTSGSASPAARRTIKPSFNCQYAPSLGVRRRTATPRLSGSSNSSQSLVIFCASLSSYSVIPGNKKARFRRGWPGFAGGVFAPSDGASRSETRSVLLCVAHRCATAARRAVADGGRRLRSQAQGHCGHVLESIHSMLASFPCRSCAPCARANKYMSSPEGGTAGRREKDLRSVPPIHLAECRPVRCGYSVGVKPNCGLPN